MEDEPIRMAGLGMSPVDIRDGLADGSLRDLIARERLPRLMSGADALWMARGAYEPREAFEA